MAAPERSGRTAFRVREGARWVVRRAAETRWKRSLPAAREWAVGVELASWLPEFNPHAPEVPSPVSRPSESRPPKPAWRRAHATEDQRVGMEGFSH